MPVPRHATSIPNRELPAAPGYGGLTELRIHGVGGTPPAGLLRDLAPEQVSGDRIAGCYRSSDRPAPPGRPGGGRHVECYSWGGLTSRSRSRVLWLLLLPFLLANLAGWMCTPRTRASRWRFALHRTAAGLTALALTVNVALVTVVAGAGVLAYQAVRAGRAAGQWWLAPLRWPLIAGFPARQVLIGVIAPGLFLLLLAGLSRLSRQRYERVPPPYREGHQPARRSAAAASLRGGLADEGFWDGEVSVARLARLHSAAAMGFLAIALAVTTRALAGPGHGPAVLWWAAVAAGAAAATGAAGLLAADTAAHRPRLQGAGSAAALWLAAAGLAAAAAWAWALPGEPVVRDTAVQLPGLAGLAGWTALAVAAPVALLALSVALGAGGARQADAGQDRPARLPGGPLVTAALAFSVANLVLLGLLIWVAHVVGPVTTGGRAAGHIWLPGLIVFGVPLAALAAVAAAAVFLLAQTARCLCPPGLPAAVLAAYRRDADQVRGSQPAQLRPWYCSALSPPARPGDPGGAARAAAAWQRRIARRRLIARMPRDAGWLLWGLAGAQAAALAATWWAHLVPPLYLRNLGTVLAAGLLTPFIGYLYAAWRNPARRRHLAELWDVGTFWPRSYHPFSPPCYAERAVPDVQRRLWWLHDQGGRALLVAHSQGAVLALAALLQPGCRARGDRPLLVTLGNPACHLYAWGFPAYLGPQVLAPLGTAAGDLGGWRNVYYPGDPIGGPVTVAPAGPSPAPAAGSPAPGGPAAGGPDLPLADPAGCWYVYGQPPPAPQGHSGYWSDPRFWEAVDALAAAAAVPAQSRPSPG